MAKPQTVQALPLNFHDTGSHTLEAHLESISLPLASPKDILRTATLGSLTHLTSFCLLFPLMWDWFGGRIWKIWRSQQQRAECYGQGLSSGPVGVRRPAGRSLLRLPYISSNFLCLHPWDGNCEQELLGVADMSTKTY